MALKKHHKIVLGGFSTFLVLLLISNSIFIYILYGQLKYDYNQLNNEIENMQRETNNKINELIISIIETEKAIENVSSDIGSIDSEFAQLDQEFNKLKSSVSHDFSEIIENSIKSVVTIRTDINQGTGFIINKNGYIITNYHVIKGARAAAVYDFKGEKHSVALIGDNKQLDLALLKIEGDYKTLEFENSDSVEIGEKVIAIGNPLGLQFSVSEGIVSAIHRDGPNEIGKYIQTDTPLNPGNSGGPLINKQGKVIGINNFKIGTAESLGFALESNYIEKSINSIAQEKLNKTLI